MKIETPHLLTGKTAYLSGAIAADAHYRARFATWEDLVLAVGAARVLNPARLPDGWTYAEYMEHCLLMVRRAGVIVRMPTWQHSPGASVELAYARSLGIPVVYTHGPGIGEAP